MAGRHGLIGNRHRGRGVGAGRDQLEIVPCAPVGAVIGAHPQRLRAGRGIGPEPHVGHITGDITPAGIDISAIRPPVVAAHAVPDLKLHQRIAVHIVEVQVGQRQKRPFVHRLGLIGNRHRRRGVRGGRDQLEIVPVAPVRAVKGAHRQGLRAVARIALEPDAAKVAGHVAGRRVHPDAIGVPVVQRPGIVPQFQRHQRIHLDVRIVQHPGREGNPLARRHGLIGNRHRGRVVGHRQIGGRQALEGDRRAISEIDKRPAGRIRRGVENRGQLRVGQGHVVEEERVDGQGEILDHVVPVARAKAEHVRAVATYQRVIAAHAPDRVMAAAAFQLVGHRVAREHVVEPRTGDPFDAGHRVEEGRPVPHSRGLARVEVHIDGACHARPVIAQRVKAQPGIQRVGPGSEDEYLVRRTPRNRVVVVRRAQLEITGSDRVHPEHALVDHACRQIGRDTVAHPGIADAPETWPADVVGVVARAPDGLHPLVRIEVQVEYVALLGPIDAKPPGRPAGIQNIRHVQQRRARGRVDFDEAGIGGTIDVHRHVGAVKIRRPERVDVHIAVDDIDKVDRVLIGAYADLVKAGRAADIVPGVDRIVARRPVKTVIPGPAQKRVIPVVAKERIVPGPADQAVVATAPIEPVVHAVAGDHVVQVRPANPLDPGDVVRKCHAACAAGHGAHSQVQVGHDARVQPAAVIAHAVEPVTRVQRIVAGPENETLAVGRAQDRIVARPGRQLPQDAGDHVHAAETVLRHCPGAQIGDHAGRGSTVIQPQLRGACHRDVDRVVARARGELHPLLVAEIDVQHVIGTGPGQAEATGRPARIQRVGNVQQGVGLGPRLCNAAGIGHAVDRRRDRTCQRAVEQPDIPAGDAGCGNRIIACAGKNDVLPGIVTGFQKVVARPAVQRVVTVPALQRVIAGKPVDHIIARPARQKVIAARAGQNVVLGCGGVQPRRRQKIDARGKGTRGDHAVCDRGLEGIELGNRGDRRKRVSTDLEDIVDARRILDDQNDMRPRSAGDLAQRSRRARQEKRRSVHVC